MVTSGDWLTPQLNGFKYFEKPPLQYWMTAASFSLFGQTNTSARLWVAVISFTGMLWTMYLGTCIWGRTSGFYTLLILSSSLLYIGFGHIVTLDMALSVFISIGLGSFIIAQQYRNDNPKLLRNWMLLGWAMLGLAILTKGLIGIVLPGISVMLYSLWQRDWLIWKYLHLGKGLTLLLIITAPWFVFISLKNPEFPQFFFIHEHFQRYTSNVHNRNHPFWYVPAILVAGFLPWFKSVLYALFKPATSKRTITDNKFNPVLFLWIFSIFTLLFFSLSHSVLPGYVIPVFPALALIMGRQFSIFPTFRNESITFVVLGAGILILSFFIEHFSNKHMPSELLLAYQPWIWIAACTMIIGGLISRLAYSSLGDKALVTLAVSSMLSLIILIQGYQQVGWPRSSKYLATAIEPYLDKNIEIYSFDTYPQSLPFYLDRTIHLVKWKGELEMGIELQPKSWYVDLNTLLKQIRQQEKSIVVMRVKSYRKLEKQFSSSQIIYQDPRKIALLITGKNTFVFPENKKLK
ncbi:MAG: glycosyltransferase family 39 protein [gamma proteobacterium symbiont of Bathyaustriella thionipta]|nr:glycosyltransferase family 39 protein [gamma proteobacterium symbiont of Bathyaustriella thionipta]MCU7954077.1 glycosyltransferase family 39 protein [gamma proteobacterium symbiont of Bathyaustriella thionipta]